ncbi:unnamed protein product [Larinioides sclopetarius]|uniref:Uncharacterized protein n=1 Tax=Larinioides sclopetarius TaxID=280406 RepID=A0AAV2BX25_9ARAC
METLGSGGAGKPDICQWCHILGDAKTVSKRGEKMTLLKHQSSVGKKYFLSSFSPFFVPS